MCVPRQLSCGIQSRKSILARMFANGRVHESSIEARIKKRMPAIGSVAGRRSEANSYVNIGWCVRLRLGRLAWGRK